MNTTRFNRIIFAINLFNFPEKIRLAKNAFKSHVETSIKRSMDDVVFETGPKEKMGRDARYDP